MPLDYYCEGCGLVFSVGVYTTRSRYPARRLLVCQACGTVHEHRTPLREADRSRLVALPGPVLRPQKPERPAFLDRRLPWQELALTGWGPRGEGELHTLACSHCKGTGALTDRWEADRKQCPGCGTDGLVVGGGWVT